MYILRSLRAFWGFTLFILIPLFGCASMETQISKQRIAFLSNPQCYQHSFDGKLIGDGAAYKYLVDNDPNFGIFILQNLSSSTSPELPKIAIDYFIWKHHDEAMLARVIELVPSALWNAIVTTGNTDVISTCTLREYLDIARHDYAVLHTKSCN